jgi:tRNA-specific 2-thiouridylase
MSKKVYVGMSGGVDSSVTAALLKQQGYTVTGVYMKNWSKDIPGYPCPWKEDYQDAKRVAVQLGIEFKMFDFEKDYFELVVQYMLDAFESGITPNPDIMCNQEIKFRLFLDAALQSGADLIATGHYANVEHLSSGSELRTAKDANKDQTYFLYRVTEGALSKTLFPLGDLTKPEVRVLAKQFGLATATKKESMGICFVGKVGIKEFLQQYVTTKPGKIIDQNGVVVGEHDGAIFYTTGQRHGLNVGGGAPIYVVGKDMKKNEVYVTNDLQDDRLWRKHFQVGSAHWINQPPEAGNTYQVRTRHRAAMTDCTITKLKDDTYVIALKDDIRALTPGQSAVVYDGQHVLGGGIII